MTYLHLRLLRTCGRALILIACWATASPAASVPPLSHRVTDVAQLLDTGHRDALEARLADFEEKTSHQIAVLTVPSLDGESIEAFAIRVTDAWGLGDRKRDNGILLLAAAQEHKIRIEVGRGLEGVVTDAAASGIIRDVMVPHFARANYAVGIDAGVTALMALSSGEVFATQPRLHIFPKGLGLDRWGLNPLVVLFGALFVFSWLMIRVVAWFFPNYDRTHGRSLGQASTEGADDITFGGNQGNGSGGSGGGFGGFGGGGGGFGGGGASGGW